MLTKLSREKQDDWDDYINVACFQLLMRQLRPMVTNLRGSHTTKMFKETSLPLFYKWKLTPFPSKLITKNSANAIFKFEIHCHCRMPELKTTPMIECMNCCKQYHIVCCQGIPKKCLDDSTVATPNYVLILIL